MIPPYKKITRIDIDAETFEKFMKSECSFHEESWDIVEQERYSQATWDGDANHQILKANLDEAQTLSKNHYDKANIAKRELRQYEDERIEYFRTHKTK